MNHNEYWKRVWEEAHERLHKLFAKCKISLCDIVYDHNGIDSYEDARKVLTFIYAHNPTAEEKACGTLSVVEALQALHELNEHRDVK